MVYPERAPSAEASGDVRGGSSFAVAALLGVLLLGPLFALVLHNRLVSRREGVDAAWAQVESNAQRRADLVPALVEVLKRHLRHEQETLVAVLRARSDGLAALAALGGKPPANEAQLRELERAQAEVGARVTQLFALAESHPELRSADDFLELQSQLEGAENRINVARMRFNEAVRDYNAALEQLPTAWIASARGEQRRPYFQAEESARNAPALGLD